MAWQYYIVCSIVAVFARIPVLPHIRFTRITKSCVYVFSSLLGCGYLLYGYCYGAHGNSGECGLQSSVSTHKQFKMFARSATSALGYSTYTKLEVKPVCILSYIIIPACWYYHAVVILNVAALSSWHFDISKKCVIACCSNSCTWKHNCCHLSICPETDPWSYICWVSTTLSYRW